MADRGVRSRRRASADLQYGAAPVILVCFDGSTDAQAAIDRAGELFGGRSTTVLTVWEPFVETMARTGAGFGLEAAMVDVDEIDAASARAAREQAQAGVERAQRAGLNAQPRVACRTTTIAGTILAQAEDVGADAIVLGTRGLTGLKSLLLGSVSHAVVQHADRPVMVVPSGEVAAERAASRR
jgi:nucleotide-binding universal stress UspA family protein